MNKSRGFVLIEIVVVFGMLAVLTIMTTLNVFGSNRTASLTGAINILIADMKSQQTKAMTGSQVSGVSPLGFGIHFDSTGYTLFKGLTYSATEPTNSRINNDIKVRFSNISLPNGSLVYASRSGEFVGYSSTSSTVTVTHIDSGISKTVFLNKYGVITAIN